MPTELATQPTPGAPSDPEESSFKRRAVGVLYDGHPSETGVELAAEEISRRLHQSILSDVP